MMLRRELATAGSDVLVAARDTDAVVRSIVDQELARREAAEWVLFDQFGRDA